MCPSLRRMDFLRIELRGLVGVVVLGVVLSPLPRRWPKRGGEACVVVVVESSDKNDNSRRSVPVRVPICGEDSTVDVGVESPVMIGCFANVYGKVDRVEEPESALPRGRRYFVGVVVVVVVVPWWFMLLVL